MTVGEHQRRALASDGNGGKIKMRRMNNGLLRSVCPECGQTCFAITNLGNMDCTHCGTHIDDWAWGRIEHVFVPEEGET